MRPTDNYGYFLFTNVSNGTYIIEPSCNKAWGGGNSADALLIMKHFVGLDTLFALALQAADVSAGGYVNSMELLLMVNDCASHVIDYVIEWSLYERSHTELISVSD